MSSKPTGPAEFLPLLLALTSTVPSAGDPFTSTSTPQNTNSTLPADDILPFLNDLANGVSSEQLADTITPTLSLFFQQWFRIEPTPDLLGQEWRQYLGAMFTLAQVKPIAAIVSPMQDEADYSYRRLVFGWQPMQRHLRSNINPYLGR